MNQKTTSMASPTTNSGTMTTSQILAMMNEDPRSLEIAINAGAIHMAQGDYRIGFEITRNEIDRILAQNRPSRPALVMRVAPIFLQSVQQDCSAFLHPFLVDGRCLNGDKRIWTVAAFNMGLAFHREALFNGKSYNSKNVQHLLEQAQSFYQAALTMIDKIQARPCNDSSLDDEEQQDDEAVLMLELATLNNLIEIELSATAPRDKASMARLQDLKERMRQSFARFPPPTCQPYDHDCPVYDHFEAICIYYLLENIAAGAA